MKTMEEILEYISENDVKFVKLSFCDIFGRQKNVSVNASYFKEACGEGVEIDSSAVGFPTGDTFRLYPMVETITTLPWRPSAGSVVNVICNIGYRDGAPFEGDCCRVIWDAERDFAQTGCSISFMTESEFYITKLDESGEPTLTPVDRAGYLDAAPLDRCENLRRDIVFTLEAMGMEPHSSHHEHGPGQNAVIFRANTAFRSSVNTLLFRSAVRNIANINGLYATFAPSPLEGMIGSNFRIVVDLADRKGAANADKTRAFARGVLARLPEMAIFTNPVRNSYKRLLYKSTPAHLTLNGPLSAVRTGMGNGKVEILSADTACNPFVVLALVLEAGREGLEGRAPEPVEGATLPGSLTEAVEAAEKSEFLRRALPSAPFAIYIDAKRKEAAGLKREDILAAGL